MSNQTEMLIELPPVYRESPDFREMAKVQGKIFDRLERDIDDVLNQFFIDSATWGLDLMEKDFKIPLDLNKTLDQRRSVLKAAKRGIGTVSASMIKGVVESFSVKVKDINVVKERSEISIILDPDTGTILNLRNIKDTVQKIIPAHLQTNYLVFGDSTKITAVVNAYSFPVHYPTTGTFYTAPISGVASKSTVTAESKTYANLVPYPVTGTFYCSEGDE